MEEQPDSTQDIMTAIGRMAAAIQRGSEVLVKQLQTLNAEIERLTKRVQALEQKPEHAGRKDA